MKTSTKTLVSLGAVLAGCATGGGGGLYSQPYALFEPERRSVVDDRAPAHPMSIDGRVTVFGEYLPVAPGQRTVVVSIPGPRGMSDPGRTSLVIDAKPCTRYYFGAKRSSRTASDWEGYLVTTEPIAECRNKFPGNY